MSDLPSLYPFTRSGRKRQIPTKLFDTVFFCQEYPNGVYIDKKGHPSLGTILNIPDDKLQDVVPKCLLHTLVPHERREQIDMREDIKCRTSHQDYIDDDVDYNPDSNETDHDAEEDEGDDDEDEFSSDIDTEGDESCEDEDSDESDSTIEGDVNMSQ
jgi:hypothetical protein